jgi:predicted RNA-binding protein YlxR (DUF448 family)
MTGGPIRSCAACRRRRPQAELVRVASEPGGTVSVDPWEPETGRRRRRSAGRGAYVCPDPACVDRAVATGAIARALRLKGRLPESSVESLRSQIALDEGRDG